MQESVGLALTGLGNFGRTIGPSGKTAKCGVRVRSPLAICVLMFSHVDCPLPPLSVLLENPRIRDTDSFVICVQIHCPVGPFFPHQPSASYVPKDLLDGLEALLDNASKQQPTPC